MPVKVITPYVFDEEIKEHKNTNWMLNSHYEKDKAGIGCDLDVSKNVETNFQTMIFLYYTQIWLLHHEGWFEEVLELC